MKIKELIDSYNARKASGEPVDPLRRLSWVDWVEGDVGPGIDIININNLAVKNDVLGPILAPLPATIITLNATPDTVITISRVNKLAVIKDSGCRCVVM